MRVLLKILAFFFGIIIITALHIGAAFIFPVPFSYANILFIILLLYILIADSGVVVWIAFVSHFIVELHTSTTPFGIILFSGTIAILFSFWLHRHTITNRSWLSGAALTALSLLIYRLIYFFALGIVDFFNPAISVYWVELAIICLWEILISTFAVGLFYFILSRVWPRLEQTKTNNLTVSRW